MKPQDLRIGNMLIDSLTGSALKVSDISEAGFTTTVIDRSKFPLPDGWKAMPISLTEEWLIRKLGFEKSYTSNVRTRFDLIDDVRIGYDFNNYGETDGLEGFRYVGNYFPHIKFVHQLQNLYHSLTGNELTVNI